MRFLGYCTDVRPYLWAADFFVMPSLYEGFGVAVLEEMACGLRMVLANSPGLRWWAEIFPGIIYAEPDAESLAAAIASTLESRTSADQVALSNRVAEIFSVNRGAQEYLELYQGRAGVQVTGNKQSTHPSVH